VFERRLTRDTGVIGVREDGSNDFLRVAALAQNLCALGGMFAVGGMIVVGPTLLIEIVEEGSEAPGFFIGAVLASVGANAGFDG